MAAFRRPDGASRGRLSSSNLLDPYGIPAAFTAAPTKSNVHNRLMLMIPRGKEWSTEQPPPLEPKLIAHRKTGSFTPSK